MLQLQGMVGNKAVLGLVERSVWSGRAPSVQRKQGRQDSTAAPAAGNDQISRQKAETKLVVTVRDQPVPAFEGLRKEVQDELIACGADYFYESSTPIYRLSFLNIYAKMKLDGLAGYIAEVHRGVLHSEDPSPGQLKLLILDLEGFKRELSRRKDYTSPSKNTPWDSHSKDSVGQLHFKHFRNWGNTVAVHIDPQGFVWYNPFQMLRHALTYSHYKDPNKSTEALRSVPAANESLKNLTRP